MKSPKCLPNTPAALAHLSPMEYARLVAAESRGEAPEATELLALDPFRWAAHLGCVIGDITDQLASFDLCDEQRRRCVGARSAYIARKGDVVALRRRTQAIMERDRAVGALRQVLSAATDQSLTDEEALTQVAAIARQVLA